jgi:hypothetical protein
MTAYLTIKSVLMAVAIIGAFGVFYTRARHLVRLMKNVQGRSSVVPDRVAERKRKSATALMPNAWTIS